ncbi:MAG TPA: glycosyltransferase family 9 protein [Candidatus Hydrogenedentes bacterium]|nr:glycosyltransferase family 9 protein [Candidatus Hydrogenedentota bacterium]
MPPNAPYEEPPFFLQRHGRRAIRGFRMTLKRLMGRPISILVDVRWRLGDEIMALPIYAALKRRYRASTVCVACTYPELLLDNPYVDAVNPCDGATDWLLSLRGAPRTVNRLMHLARMAHVAVPEETPRLYYEDWNTPLLEGIPDADKGFVAVAAGASWPTKRWPLECWRELARALEKQGYPVVELGMGHTPIGAGTNLAGRTTVREAACVLHAARLLISGDSGLMHLALAAGTPVIALFGPTRPDILFRHEPRLTSVRNGRACQGCWNASERNAVPGECPRGIPDCLGSIGVETVLTRAMERLEGGA